MYLKDSLSYPPISEGCNFGGRKAKDLTWMKAVTLSNCVFGVTPNQSYSKRGSHSLGSSGNRGFKRGSNNSKASSTPKGGCAQALSQ